MKAVFVLLFLVVTKSAQPLVCQDVLTQTDCKDLINGIHECMWSSNACVDKKCELMTVPCDGQIYQNVACSTSGSNCVSVSDCTKIDNQTSCSTVKAGGQTCIWDTTCRIKQCSDYDMATCSQSNADYCFFKDNLCQPVVKCSDVSTQTLCESIKLDNKCQWASNTCDNFSCSRITDIYSCYSTVTSDDSCFNGALDSTVNCMSCLQFKEQCDCLKYSMFGCAWSTDSCYRQACEQITNQQLCAQAFDKVTCVWYPNLAICTSISKANDYDRQCDLYSYTPILVTLIIYLIL